jgi:hypothetical protein
VSAIYDPKVYSDADSWRLAQKKCDLRYQWDPERDLSLNKIDSLKSLQIGIGPACSKTYVEKWIMEIADITDVVKQLRNIKGKDRATFNPFIEKPYDVPVDIRQNLGIEFTKE